MAVSDVLVALNQKEANVNAIQQASTEWSIRVLLWAGTQQREFFAESYAAAMDLVDRWHRNAHSPQFFDREGNRLIDCSGHFEPEPE